MLLEEAKECRGQAHEFLGSHGVAVVDFDPAELDREAQLQELAASHRSSQR